MPQFHDHIDQGTPEWIDIRLGIPTASCFDNIITSGGAKSSKSEAYINELLAERITGAMQQRPYLEAMERGHQLEPEAVKYYEFVTELKTEPVGFVSETVNLATDVPLIYVESTYGASPDRLVGEDGCLEIKCPLGATHVGYMRTGAVSKVYYPQLQGQLFVTGRQWVEIVSYHPEMQWARARVQRDEPFIEKLQTYLFDFLKLLESEDSRLRKLGYFAIADERQAEKAKHLITPPPTDYGWLGVNDEDLRVIQEGKDREKAQTT